MPFNPFPDSTNDNNPPPHNLIHLPPPRPETPETVISINFINNFIEFYHPASLSHIEQITLLTRFATFLMRYVNSQINLLNPNPSPGT